jgi:hypothetical protein
MTRLRLLLILLSVTLLQVGCASSDTSPTAGNVDASGNTVSSTPWNKPESWETGGQLGNAMGN